MLQIRAYFRTLARSPLALKPFALTIVSMLVVAIGHAAEPKSLSSDGQESSPTSAVSEKTVHKRLSLSERWSSRFMEAFDADRNQLAEQVQPINEHSVREALRQGRAILGFELIAPLPEVGFWVEQAGTPVGTVGDDVAWQEGLSLRVKLPLAAEIRVLRNGKSYHEAKSDALEMNSLPEDVYRLEAFQQLAGQRYPWVLSNPIYVSKPR